MNYNPYAGPNAPQPPSYYGNGAQPPQPPQVWRYYLGYAISMAVLYLLVAVVGVVIASSGTFMAPEPGQPPMPAGLFVVVGVVLGIPFLAAPFLPKAPWAWIYHIVLISVGMTSVCCMPISIPLLIFWLKPETKAFFGRA